METIRVQDTYVVGWLEVGYGLTPTTVYTGAPRNSGAFGPARVPVYFVYPDTPEVKRALDEWYNSDPNALVPVRAYKAAVDKAFRTVREQRSQAASYGD